MRNFQKNISAFLDICKPIPWSEMLGKVRISTNIAYFASQIYPEGSENSAKITNYNQIYTISGFDSSNWFVLLLSYFSINIYPVSYLGEE